MTSLMFLDFDEIPRFESDRVTPERMKKIENIFLAQAKRLDESLGRKANFQDFIAEKTYKNGIAESKRLFNGYIYGWNLIGRTTENAKEVYFKQIVEFEQGYSSNQSKLAWSDAVIDDASNSFTKIEITRAEDGKPLIEVIECERCGVDFNGLSFETLCGSCKSKEKLVKKATKKNDVNSKGKSFNTFLYVIIGVVFLIFIYRLGKIPFIVIGALVLFALMYIGDKEGWGK